MKKGMKPEDIMYQKVLSNIITSMEKTFMTNSMIVV